MLLSEDPMEKYHREEEEKTAREFNSSPSRMVEQLRQVIIILDERVKRLEEKNGLR